MSERVLVKCDGNLACHCEHKPLSVIASEREAIQLVMAEESGLPRRPFGSPRNDETKRRCHNRDGEPALREDDTAGAFKFAVGPSAKCDAKRLMIQVRKRATASSFKSSGWVER